MLGFFRNSQGPIMWVVAAIVIVAFTFFYDAGKVQNRQDTEVMFEIGDESYTQQDWNTALGPLYGQFIFRMGSDYIDLFQQLTSERASTSDSRSMRQAFVYNLMLLRERAKDYEIHISDDDIVKEIKKIDLFQVRDTLGQPLNQFDIRQWELFKAQFLSAEYTEENFKQFIADKLRIDLEELENYFNLPLKTYNDYPNQAWLYKKILLVNLELNQLLFLPEWVRKCNRYLQLFFPRLQF